ncbi:hypothetical protein HK107_03430 [Parvularcula sp. ZS-1/3]|uniref:Flagellar hook-length control protein-like C-terminal domain-containing protein n=1 Tax=Parvularcula mediterranea TaxID=2732508 RepID=A0A7Y3RJT4_9PROT|nr:flagellar hook-length control protein FliK [Parvularcula mediterranea]NNU15378.1 hypothetical protein [Parvularcula mediterranea]
MRLMIGPQTLPSALPQNPAGTDVRVPTVDASQSADFLQIVEAVEAMAARQPSSPQELLALSLPPELPTGVVLEGTPYADGQQLGGRAVITTAGLLHIPAGEETSVPREGLPVTSENTVRQATRPARQPAMRQAVPLQPADTVMAPERPAVAKPEPASAAVGVRPDAQSVDGVLKASTLVVDKATDTEPVSRSRAATTEVSTRTTGQTPPTHTNTAFHIEDVRSADRRIPTANLQAPSPGQVAARRSTAPMPQPVMVTQEAGARQTALPESVQYKANTPVVGEQLPQLSAHASLQSTPISDAPLQPLQLSTPVTTANAAPGTPASAVQTTSHAIGAQAPSPAEQVQVAIARAENSGRIELRLDPPELGRVQIDLDLSKGQQVRAVITAAEPETLDLMRRQGAILAEALANEGFEGIDLAFGGDGQAPWANPGPRQFTPQNAGVQPQANVVPSHDGLLDLSL